VGTVRTTRRSRAGSGRKSSPYRRLLAGWWSAAIELRTTTGYEFRLSRWRACPAAWLD
jgi:hypothetical protein